MSGSRAARVVEAVVGAQRGEGGDRGGDLGGGGGGQGVVGAGAVEPLAGGDVDDGGRCGGCRAPRPSGAGSRTSARARPVGADLTVSRRPQAAEDGEARMRALGAGRGAGAGRIGITAVICATRPFQGGRPVPLGRTLTGGVPGAGGGRHGDGQRQTGGGGARGVLPGPHGLPAEPLPCGPHPRELRFRRGRGPFEARSHGVRGSFELRAYGPAARARCGRTASPPAPHAVSRPAKASAQARPPAPFAITHLREGHLTTRSMC